MVDQFDGALGGRFDFADSDPTLLTREVADLNRELSSANSQAEDFSQTMGTALREIQDDAWRRNLQEAGRDSDKLSAGFSQSRKELNKLFRESESGFSQSSRRAKDFQDDLASGFRSVARIMEQSFDQSFASIAGRGQQRLSALIGSLAQVSRLFAGGGTASGLSFAGYSGGYGGSSGLGFDSLLSLRSFGGSGFSSTINQFGSQFGLANVPSDFVGPLLPGQTAGTTLSGFLGAAGLGALGGGLVASLFGGNTTGGSIGGGLGAGIASLAGLGPVGLVAGGLLGGITGGLFGKKEKNPAAGAQVSFSGDGGEIIALASKHISSDAARSLGDTALALLQQVLDTTGASLTQDFIAGFGYDQRGGFVETSLTNQAADGSLSQIAGTVRRVNSSNPEAIYNDFLRNILDAGYVDGVSPLVSSIIQGGSATTSQELLSNIQVASGFEEIISSIGAPAALGGALGSFSSTRDSLESLADQLINLGASANSVNNQLAAANDNLTDELAQYFDDTILGFTDPLALEIRTLEEQRDQWIELLSSFGLGAERANELFDLELSNLTQRDAVRSGRAQLRGSLDGLLLGDQSALSFSEQLSYASAQFNATSALAAGGDRTALADLSRVSGNYIDVARRGYASSSAYDAIFNEVVGVLESFVGTQQFGPGVNDNVGVIAALGSVEATSVNNAQSITNAISGLESTIDALQQRLTRLETQRVG